jgi:hypothetical protein
MLVLLTFMMALVGFWALRRYQGENGGLLPASTPKGKEGRIVLGSILAAALVLVILNNSDGVRHSKLWAVTTLSVIGIPIVHFIYSKNRDKK